MDNSKKIDNIALQNIRENTELQTEELAISLSNKIETITSTMAIISDAPSIHAPLSIAKSLLYSGQKSTKNLTEFYAWIDKGGKIIWTTLFDNKTFYENYSDLNLSNREHFKVVKEELKPHISAVMKSISGSNTIFISYPILGNKTQNINDIQHDDNNYTVNKIEMITKQENTQQQNTIEKIKSYKVFDGTILSGINTTSMIKLLESQILPKNRSDINLIDRNGFILTASNPEFNGLVVNSKGYDQTLGQFYDKKNQGIIYQVIEKILTGKIGNAETINDRFGNSTIISYKPIIANDQILFYVILSTPYEFATEVNNLILQQQNFAMGSIILTGIIALLITIILGLFNKNLRRLVEEKTSNLKNAITSLEKSNEQLKLHDKMQQEFINVTAHELRTPIQSIMGYVEMIKSYPDRLSTYLQPIERNTQRLYRLIEDILDITKIETGNLKLIRTTFDMNEKITNVIKDINAKKNVNNKSTNQKIDLVFQPTKEPIMIFADKDRIYQVISNLVRNAMKFISSNDGKIEIILEKVEDDDKEDVSVTIRDNGKGIDIQVLPHLFEKFATKSEAGTGLGLYLSKNIINSHGGKIWGKNNEDGVGAEFGFTIPLN
jgi:signal transduction histidine kinase